MSNSRFPSIAAIQLTNAVILAIAVGILGRFVSPSAALGCLLGGSVVVANFFILAALGRMIVAAASANASGLAKLSVAAIPLKLVLVAGLVYLLFARTGINGLGFGVGVFTQTIAIFVETGRSAIRATN
ncbi:MAG TPA: ATP synthase subunit I [Candidatus Binataceae bacterium]|nr:ATP synthase subunit I [Candidatus Binataceae bacterium]